MKLYDLVEKNHAQVSEELEMVRQLAATFETDQGKTRKLCLGIGEIIKSILSQLEHFDVQRLAEGLLNLQAELSQLQRDIL